MFEHPNRQLEFLERSIIRSGKYIEKFDALSISAVTLEGSALSSSDGNIERHEPPKMESLNKLTSEIGHILNEAYIEQQSALASIKIELAACEAEANAVVKVLRPYQPDLLFSNASEVESAESLLGPLEELADYTTLPDPESSPNTRQALLMEQQLKSRLHELYEKVQGMIDSKLGLLNIVQKVTDVYLGSMITIANENGVIRASEKAISVITPHFNPLIQNRFFSTTEEEVILGSVRGAWAFLLLHCREHRQLAERQLAPVHGMNDQWQQHIKMGSVLVLLLWAISECFNNETTGREIWRDLTFSIFMCFGDLFLLLVMWGVSMRVWRGAGIDFIRLLQLEHTEIATSKAPDQMVISSATDLCIVFLVGFICFNKVVRSHAFGENNLAVAHAIPTCFVLYSLFRIIYPLVTRKHWLFMLWRVLAAPAYSVSFRDGYIGDLLTSLVRVLIPLCFSLVYVAISFYSWFSNDMSMITTRKDRWWTEAWYYKVYLVPFLTLLPLWLRLMQCLRRSVETGQRWPHMGNACKYTSAIVVISYGTYQPFLREDPTWVAGLVFATFFQFTWDLTMDWGLFSVNTPQHGLPYSSSSGIAAVDCIVSSSINFRRTRLLGPLWVYGLVVAGNFLLRFAWTLTLLPVPSDEDAQANPIYASLMLHIGPVLAAAEIMRRMVWGFFRLEWEQVEQLQKKSKQLDSDNADSDTEPFKSFDKMGISNSIEMQSLGGLGGSDYSALPPAVHQPPDGAAARARAASDDDDDGYVMSGPSSSQQGQLQQGQQAWTEADWSWLLPAYARVYVSTTPRLRALPTYEAKLRVIEAVLFGAAVVAIVLHAGWPALTQSIELRK